MYLTWTSGRYGWEAIKEEQIFSVCLNYVGSIAWGKGILSYRMGIHAWQGFWIEQWQSIRPSKGVEKQGRITHHDILKFLILTLARKNEKSHICCFITLMDVLFFKALIKILWVCFKLFVCNPSTQQNSLVCTSDSINLYLMPKVFFPRWLFQYLKPNQIIRWFLNSFYNHRTLNQLGVNLRQWNHLMLIRSKINQYYI